MSQRLPQVPLCCQWLHPWQPQEDELLSFLPVAPSLLQASGPPWPRTVRAVGGRGAAGATGPPDGEITVPRGRGNGDPKPGEQTTVTHACVISCRAPHLRLRWGPRHSPSQQQSGLFQAPTPESRESGHAVWSLPLFVQKSCLRWAPRRSSPSVSSKATSHGPRGLKAKQVSRTKPSLFMNISLLKRLFI